MGWRDQLRVASFRGVRFHIEDVAGEGGRRAQVVEYPLRDEPFVEDLGRKARRYRLAAYVLGPDYGGARDALIKACEESGPGTLIHPFQGEIRAVCDALSYAESRDRGGHCRFDLSFVEAGAASAPADSPATQYVARQSADLATGSALSDFRRRFPTISGARGLAGGAPSLPLDLTLARLSSNDAAVPFAQDLAETVNRSIQLFRSSSSMPGGFAGLRRLSVFGVDRTPVQPSTPSRRQQGDNRDALRFLVRRSAAIEQSRLASYAEFGDPDATRAYRVDFSSAPAFGSLPDWTADASPSDRLPPYNASSPPLVIASNQ
ncbi:MAG: DNA circularization N-terminal domain-containing protein, partial [Rhodospirillales bacterium]|nr:DNA circularization N-terminal domain-containing protein [Rhodospirillales bacterium]